MTPLKFDTVGREYFLKQRMAGYHMALEDWEGRGRIMHKVIDQLNYYHGMRNEMKIEPEKMAEVVHFMVDQAIIFDKARAPKDMPPISCKRGCSACCSLFVEITHDEAALIKKDLVKSGLKIDREKLARQAMVDAKKWHDQSKEDQKCVFLGVDGACQIYPVRPVSCRKYFSVDDPKRCEVTPENKGQGMWKFVSLSAEILSCGPMTVTGSGGLAKMLNAVLNEE